MNDRPVPMTTDNLITKRILVMPLLPAAEARIAEECERLADSIHAALVEMNVRDGILQFESYGSVEAANNAATRCVNPGEQQRQFKSRLLQAIRKTHGLDEITQSKVEP